MVAEAFSIKIITYFSVYKMFSLKNPQKNLTLSHQLQKTISINFTLSCNLFVLDLDEEFAMLIKMIAQLSGGTFRSIFLKRAGFQLSMRAFTVFAKSIYHGIYEGVT